MSIFDKLVRRPNERPKKAGSNKIGDDALRHYAPLPAARGDFLFWAGRLAEARSEFKAAATLTRNVRERAFLLARADACDGQH